MTPGFEASTNEIKAHLLEVCDEAMFGKRYPDRSTLPADEPRVELGDITPLAVSLYRDMVRGEVINKYTLRLATELNRIQQEAKSQR